MSLKINKDKDMYLPMMVLRLAVFFAIVAITFLFLSIMRSIFCLIGFVAAAAIAAVSFLCWRNQWVKVIDEESFEYSTMFGKKMTCRFDEIRELKKNSDSMTLVCGNGKIHIETCAILSDRFVKAVNAVLDTKLS